MPPAKQYLTTRAIVLHQTPYRDRYAILHLYTLEAGRLSVLLPTSRKRGVSTGLLPLSEVELTVALRPRRGMADLEEVRILSPRHELRMHPIKSSQTIFLAELLYRLLQSPEADRPLYEFVSEAIDRLCSAERGVANFHLCFCLRLLEPLAILPDLDDLRADRSGGWFDLKEACFVPLPRVADHCLPPREAEALKTLCRMTFDNLPAFRLGQLERRRILDVLLLFYRLHLPTFGEIKCLALLRAS